MSEDYNHFAGTSLERLAALSDGLFAVAMTLIALEIHVPEARDIHSEAELCHAIVALAPRVLTYLLSFMTLGIFWNGQQAQLTHCTRSDRDLTWWNLTFLALIAFTPFTTELLAGFVTYRLALVLYWANILLLGLTVLGSWKYAHRAGLLKEEISAHVFVAVKRRIIVAQALYAFGALLCLINNYLSIGFIVLIQLNYAIAPRIPGLRRITT